MNLIKSQLRKNMNVLPAGSLISLCNSIPAAVATTLFLYFVKFPPVELYIKKIRFADDQN